MLRLEEYVTSEERVIAASRFRTPDRIPRYDTFWEFLDEWRTRFLSVSEHSDILICVPDETILPTHAHPVSDDGDTELFGYIIGYHTISPELPLEHFAAYDEVCREEGIYRNMKPLS